MDRIIHPALFTLMRLQARSTIRRMVRSLKTPAGAIFSILGLLMCLVWLGPALIASAFTGRADPGAVRRVTPLVIIGFCLLSFRSSSKGAGIYFTPGEVDFLFTGPFHRRELLIYKLIKAAFSLAIVAVFVSIGLLRFVRTWPAGYIGCYLTLVFITLFSMSVALVAQSLGERAYTRFRRLLLVGLVVLLGVAIGQVVGHRLPAGKEFIDQIYGSRLGAALLAPFSVFGRILTAESVGELAAWSAVALLINGCLAALTLRLDADYLETALTTSQKIYDRLQRVRRGQRMGTWGNAATARWRLTPLPRCGGIGSIAWRQLTTALRQSTGFVLTFLFIAVGVAVAVGIGGVPTDVVGAAPGFTIWFTFFLTNMVRFDFRGDLDHIDWLKTLPIRPAAVAIGELAAPVLAISAIQFVSLGAVTLAAPQKWPQIVTALLFVPLFNFFLFGVENLFFLLVPTRTIAVSPADFQAFGRQIVLMIGKMLVFAVCIGSAAVPGLLIYWLSGWNFNAFLATTWLAMLAEAAMVIPLLAWAFDRFDVTSVGGESS